MIFGQYYHWLVVHTGCSGIWGQRSSSGHFGPKWYSGGPVVELHLLLQVTWYNMKALPQKYLGRDPFEVFRNLGSRDSHGPCPPFDENMLNVSTASHYVVKYWNCVPMFVWWGYLQSVQQFQVQGPTWAIWPIWWNHAKILLQILWSSPESLSPLW